MQFHYVVAFLATLSTVLAVPTGHTFMRRDCDIAKCVIALAPTVVGCAAAAAAEGANLFADAGCLAGAANAVVNMPAACDSCLEEFGLEDKIKSAGEAVKNAAGDVKDDIKDVASDIGDKLGDIF